MTICRLFLLLFVVVQGANLASARAQSVENNATESCAALGSSDFSLVQDAPTQIIEAKLIGHSDDLPSYCEVTGYVSPNIGFALWLPSEHWNGKIFQGGCAGACGGLDWIAQCRGPLRRGYACISSDGGHRSTPLDFKWTYNNAQGPLDLSVRTPHVTALAGKAIAQRYYNQAPRKSYFFGCSGGGIQALFAAQRFPWDFDGIVAISPAPAFNESAMNNLWNGRAFTDKSGQAILRPSDLQVVHEAVVARCDLNDGVKDGLIGDPRRCDFNPAELRCTASKQTRCLTDAQIDAVQKIYNGPVTAKGERLAMPVAMKGSELSWRGAYGRPNSIGPAAADWFRYFAFQPNPGPNWQLEEFDFEQDYKRLGLSGVADPDNPDLRRLKATGSKLLVVAGWNDVYLSVPRVIDYYETVEKVMGGRAATQDFFRTFISPGMDHCTGGEGAFAVDYLSYIEEWVEKGHAPDSLIASHVSADHPKDSDYARFPLDPAKVQFSRPIYPYPVRTKYLGHGDPKDAANFGPERP